MIFLVITILLLYTTRVVSIVDESKDYLKALKAQSSSSSSSSSKSIKSIKSIKSSYIIHLDKNKLNHEEFHHHLLELQKKSWINHNIKVTHIFKDAIYGVAISCESLSIKELESVYGVGRVRHDSIKRVTSSYGDGTKLSWGLDRIDSKNLPLDGVYNHEFNGDNIDIYIVDTGIDCLHNEFKPLSGRPTREVRNVYSAFTSNLTANNDGDGHGTHVAGTAGGNYVGVAPHANIFGVQVLNEDGEGTTSGIVLALEFTLNNIKKRGRRSIVSMSLGGDCDTDNCQEDTLVMASEHLSSQNIVVVVAAGNSACNACKGSPNAAPSAINVGASDKNDTVAIFSNYGQCIDVFAPGVDIVSACPSSLCNNELTYIPLSGTSMATPHVTGVVAQLLQKYNASVNDIIKYLDCDTSKSIIKLDKIDTISKNMLLQVPKVDDNGFCNLGLGCSNNCSSQGVCLPLRDFNNSKCFCNGGYFGPDCAFTSNPYCTDNNKFTANFYDFKEDGWDYADWWITDANSGLVVDGALDALCSSGYESNDFCLPGGCYNLGVSRGRYPAEIAWSFCDMVGSAPFSAKFCVDQSGNCNQVCEGALTNITLIDTYSDGWSGAYYGVREFDTGIQIFGGSLPYGSNWTYPICLPKGCYNTSIESKDKYPEEVYYSICDKIASYNETVVVCVDDNQQCTVLGTTRAPTISPTSQSPSYDPSQSPSYDPSQSPSYDPSQSPTTAPSQSPTTAPSQSPTTAPSQSPTTAPSQSKPKPTLKPTSKSKPKPRNPTRPRNLKS